MRLSRPSLLRTSTLAAAAAAGLLLAVQPAGAQRTRTAKPTPARTPVAPKPDSTPKAALLFASVHGIVVDSVHGGQPLVGALVILDDGQRASRSNQFGEFLLDSIEPGAHAIHLRHPTLDTLGVSIDIPPVPFAAGENRIVDLAIPSSETIASALCPASRRALGPAAVIGFVRIADTEAPAVGARVSLIWYEIDQTARKVPRVRETTVNADGRYQLCGIPADMSGRLQVIDGSVTSGDIPVEVQGGAVALRSLTVADPHPEITAASRRDSTNATVASNDTTPRTKPTAPVPVPQTARVTGRIVSKSGQPLGNARVDLAGTGQATVTKANGEFSLEGLPAGTQSLEVRRLGYAPTVVAVELSSRKPANVTITMDDYVPTLETVRVEATRDRGLSDVGYLGRKRTGMGTYLDGDQIENRHALKTSEYFRMVPSLRVTPAGNGEFIVQSARDPQGGCINYVVDGSPWQSAEPGDLDQYVQPDEVVAIEVYQPNTTPAEFMSAGQGGCVTVVIWTRRRIFKK